MWDCAGTRLHGFARREHLLRQDPLSLSSRSSPSTPSGFLPFPQRGHAMFPVPSFNGSHLSSAEEVVVPWQLGEIWRPAAASWLSLSLSLQIHGWARVSTHLEDVTGESKQFLPSSDRISSDSMQINRPFFSLIQVSNVMQTKIRHPSYLLAAKVESMHQLNPHPLHLQGTRRGNENGCELR